MLDGEEWDLRVSDTRVPHSESYDSFCDSEVLRVVDTRGPHIIDPEDLDLRVTDTRVLYSSYQKDLSVHGQNPPEHRGCKAEEPWVAGILVGWACRFLIFTVILVVLGA